MNEGYPDGWLHANIHLNPETGEMHSDGDHRVRHWIEDRLTAAGNGNYLLARVRRFLHCLLGTFGRHRMVTHASNTRGVTWVGCECGKTFWGRRYTR